MTDIVITWPKSRSLDSYLEELAKAERLELVINYRVPRLPKTKPNRCFVVHDGFVRGYNRVLELTSYAAYTVSRVENDAFAGFWPAGWYIVRDPAWHPVEPIPMKGFQGFRYYSGRP